MYGDLLLDQLGVNFLGPAPLDLELLHMLTTFHWNALGSTLGWWFCHNNTVSCNEKFWVEQVTVTHPPGEGQGVGKDKGGGGVLAVRGIVAGHRLGALEGGGGLTSRLSNASLPIPPRTTPSPQGMVAK